MIDLAISTSWNAWRHDDAKSIMDEIVSYGFDSVELNFKLTEDIVDGVAPLVDQGLIKVKSLHNFCPIPESLSPGDASPDAYSLSALDDEIRKKGIHFTKKTIEAAARLGAEAVVLHCGKVEIKDSTRRLTALYEDGQMGTDEFDEIRDSMILQRRSLIKKHFDKTLLSLDELCPFAQAAGITLGIENRFYYMEIPSLEEIGLILKKFKGSTVAYWHDVGHAEVSDILGFGKHKDFLEKYASSMAGIHLHDIKGTIDHLAPGQGDFDFSLLKPYLNTSVMKIIEAHKKAGGDDIRRAIKIINSVLGAESQ
ncbi:MAG: sugar phosphate isomerase/epimerase [Candidatus Omnitrophica bacterium]|nr:sugar phosphate isomerase/epimerase [Candidatus Omnitrophota bacterium]